MMFFISLESKIVIGDILFSFGKYIPGTSKFDGHMNKMKSSRQHEKKTQLEAAWTSCALWTAVFINKIKYECEMIGND